MKLVKAKILDPTHLELTEPLRSRPGEYVEIALAEEGENEEEVWRAAARERFLAAYAEEDAIYDDLSHLSDCGGQLLS